MSFEPAISLTEQIAEHLGGQIVTGRLGQLERIQELKVARELGVSRGSVREALLILERRHLIDIIPRRGAVVSRLESQDIRDLGELFADLQTRLFVKLAQLPDADLGNCRQAVQEMERALMATLTATLTAADIEALLTARKAFYAAALLQVPDYYLTAVLHGLVPAGLRLAHRVALREDFEPRDMLRYHQALLEALCAGDQGRVRELVQAFAAREYRLAVTGARPECRDA